MKNFLQNLVESRQVILPEPPSKYNPSPASCYYSNLKVFQGSFEKKNFLKVWKIIDMINSLENLRVALKFRQSLLSLQLLNLPRNISKCLQSWKWCNYRGSRPNVICKKGVLKTFTKLIEEHLRQTLFK